MVNISDMILEHTFDAYAKRLTQPKGFFGSNEVRTAEHTGTNLGVENDKPKNRVRRVNL